MSVVILVLIHEALLAQSTSTLASVTPKPSNFDAVTTLSGLVKAQFLHILQTCYCLAISAPCFESRQLASVLIGFLKLKATSTHFR